MTTKIYKCQNCDYLVEMVRQWNGGLTCCGGPMKFCGENPLEAVPEERMPLLDLTESMAIGKSCWQFV